jgi:hypothetical protein
MDDDLDDVVMFKVDHVCDCDGSKLRNLLHAHLEFERARTLRTRCVQVLLVVTFVLALDTLAPAHGPRWLQLLVRAAWGISALAYGATTYGEWRWHAQRAWYLSELGSRDDSVRP